MFSSVPARALFWQILPHPNLRTRVGVALVNSLPAPQASAAGQEGVAIRHLLLPLRLDSSSFHKICPSPSFSPRQTPSFLCRRLCAIISLDISCVLSASRPGTRLNTHSHKLQEQQCISASFSAIKFNLLSVVGQNVFVMPRQLKLFG